MEPTRRSTCTANSTSQQIFWVTSVAREQSWSRVGEHTVWRDDIVSIKHGCSVPGALCCPHQRQAGQLWQHHALATSSHHRCSMGHPSMVRRWCAHQAMHGTCLSDSRYELSRHELLENVVVDMRAFARRIKHTLGCSARSAGFRNRQAHLIQCSAGRACPGERHKKRKKKPMCYLDRMPDGRSSRLQAGLKLGRGRQDSHLGKQLSNPEDLWAIGSARKTSNWQVS